MQQLEHVKIKDIRLGKNSRMNVTSEEIAGLMQSIKETGLLQPIGVFKDKKGYRIAYGNRRFMACSKLGMHTIPAIIHENKKESDYDLKNLAENVQRKNITLTEVGRYIEILKKDGLKTAEIAVRLGVNRNYIASAYNAYLQAPKKYRDDIIASTVKTKAEPGKITFATATKIQSARNKFNLSQQDLEKLYGAAKSSDEFFIENVDKYAAAIKDGAKDFIKAVPKRRRYKLNFWISVDELEEIKEKQVTNGQFKSVTAYMIAILRGEKSGGLKVQG